MMLFWIMAACMTLAASVAVMLPFLRASTQQAGIESAHDIEVYRDQMAELDRDRERGLIEAGQAEEARAEIGRRILRESARTGDGRQVTAGGGWVRMTAAMSVLAVPLVSWGLYAAFGSPQLPSQPLASRLEKSPKDSTIEELVARAEKHLAANPEDGRGWDVLAPVYFRLQRYDDAVSAYRNAIRLSGTTPAREAGLGEALTAKNKGIVSGDAEAAFKRALALDEEDVRSRFFLAMARAQEGEDKVARAMWTGMLPGLPEESPWRSAIGQSLARLSGERQEDPPANADAGPSTEQVAAARDMAPEERRDMIEGMVARLDERLRKEPDDAEGWQRLVRSYLVLDRKGEAKAALERGIAALGGDTDKAEALKAFAGSLGMAETR